MFTPLTPFARWPHGGRLTSFWRSVRGFTLVEMLVVVAILVLLAIIAAPAVSRMMVSGHIAKSTAGLKQLAGGVGLYVADNNGNYPLAQALSASAAPGMTASDRANTAWYEGVGRLLYPEIRERLPSGVPWMFGDPRNPNGYKGTIFWSPAAEPNANIRVASYGFNQMLSAGNFRKYPLRFRGATTVLAADNNRLSGGSSATHSLHATFGGSQYRINPRYGASRPHEGDGKATVLFLDGHVEVLDALTCEEINSNPNHKFWGDRL
jgi:prepilin-type N-terminal cleavage/methylation domain-containing protein/prepilin-type processing-associated H-X9-DG protein